MMPLFSKITNQLVSWMALLIVFIILLVIGINNGLPTDLVQEYCALFIINSLIFFLLFRVRPTMGIVMLIFLLILDVSIAGYYLLALLARVST